MNRKVVIRTGVGVILGSLVAGGTFIFGKQLIAPREEVFSKEKLGFINYVVGGNYITETNNNEMTEGVYKGYVYGLEDPFTKYLTKEEFTKQKVESDGDYIGTGIKFVWGITSQYLVVTEVVPDSPADKAGVRVGDRITHVDGIKAMMSNEMQVYEKLTYTGEKPVKYIIQDNKGENTQTIELKSSVVEIEYVEEEMVDKNIGYIKLDGLSSGTVEVIRQSLEKLEEQGAKKIVLDLRGTYSDNLEEVKALCDLFLTDGIAFSVVDKEQNKNEYMTSKTYFEQEIVIITDYYTSGAIEAFVGAVKELGRGKVVGEKTSGNGTVQVLVELEDGAGMSITNGILLTPNGMQIKGTGIEPDIKERKPTANTVELVTTGRLSKKNDVQLQTAIGVLN